MVPGAVYLKQLFQLSRIAWPRFSIWSGKLFFDRLESDFVIVTGRGRIGWKRRAVCKALQIMQLIFSQRTASTR